MRTYEVIVAPFLFFVTMLNLVGHFNTDSRPIYGLVMIVVLMLITSIHCTLLFKTYMKILTERLDGLDDKLNRLLDDKGIEKRKQ